jgi:hypothetical protein
MARALPRPVGVGGRLLDQTSRRVRSLVLYGSAPERSARRWGRAGSPRSTHTRASRTRLSDAAYVWLVPPASPVSVST